MMMYSIIDIRNQETLDQLAVLCDDQPFIATAPWALVFVVDYAKWIDLFEHTGCFEPSFVEQTGKGPRRAPGMGEFAIAAQDAVIAAEAVGLGSCYIGDVVENAEAVGRLLDLPPYTLPLSMLVLGVPAKERPATPHPVENIVMAECYRRADAATMDKQVAEMDAMFRPHAREAGERVRDIYTRKHTSPFMAEMGRSMAGGLITGPARSRCKARDAGRVGGGSHKLELRDGGLETRAGALHQAPRRPWNPRKRFASSPLVASSRAVAGFVSTLGTPSREGKVEQKIVLLLPALLVEERASLLSG